ncbi:MAG: fused MFS/spermidine synthase [Pseudomonadota bacterium]|nr:fused MFS/spermidine synthase [Pseudomonadota bacterium]
MSNSPRARATPGRRRVALGLMMASGFAGLGYQIVWTQQCALWLGHETAAVLAVVTAFFGGLALGALALGSRIQGSARPERWYAACEATIAVWSVVLALLMAPISGWVLDLTGPQPSPAWQWAVAFFGTFFVLLPATAAMGATLPAMERVMARLDREGRSIAPLYASNTLGAVVGVLATAFWLVPELGLARTAGVCAAFNVLCAIAALRLSSGAVTRAQPNRCPRAHKLLMQLAITGLLGIGYEVLVVRVLSQVAENTVYTFAMLLAVYLIGSALGAASYQRWLAGSRDADKLRDRLLCLLAAACLLGTASLWAAELIRNAITQGFDAGMTSALTAEAAIALAAFGLPTVAMGALFSHLGTQASAAGIGFGRSLGFNMLGAAFAPLLFGVLLVPSLGPKVALLLVAAGYLALSSPHGWFQPLGWGTAGSAIALALWAPPLVFIDVPEGGRVVSYREGSMAAVSVVEDAAGVSRLRIDNRQQEGSSSSLLADSRQALLPLLLHPAPKRALFLGLGTGVTASSAAADPALQVDAVELLPEVIAASTHFTRELSGDTPNPRLHLMSADARRFVRATGQRYDVIVSDNFHPARSGSGSLYTVEHFQAVRERLAAGGVFCQWLPLHQLDLDSLRSIVRAFVTVYPAGTAMLATNSLETPVLGLVARAGTDRFDLRQVRERLAVNTLPQRLGEFGIADEFALLGGFIAGPSALARFAGDAPRNTDDHPVVAYRAPRITYAPDSLPRERLLALLRELSIAPAELIDTGPDAAAPARLAAYWKARDRFIEAGQHVRPETDLQHLLSQVREPLLDVLRISPDFRPAYDPLLRMAMALGRSDAAGARALLEELQQAQPARPEAGQALGQRTAESP